jgi:AhpC/TSA family/Thiol:disulfide interchange protein DsbD, N-terminal
MLEQNGVRTAAVSYDSQGALAKFAEEHRIGFPLLSDSGSAVIRSFGIFNSNVAPGLRAYGVPHPVDYLVAPDATVIRKYFVANYQHRVTGSAVALREFGTTDEDAATVRVQSGALTAEIGFSGATAFAGQEIGFFAKFKLEPGWHIYGAPLPEAYTAASVTFDDAKVSRQTFTLPEAQPMEITPLGETLPVYSGSVEAKGSLLLKFPIDAGKTVLSGQVHFQLCSETVCEAPQMMPFELPLIIETFMVPPRKK